MTDREERQHVIEVLQNMVDWMQEIDDIATPERIHALFYAIASIKTDLKYDLLYEETSGQADKPTTKNNLGVDCISRQATVKRLCNLAEYMNEHKENSGAPYIMAALFIQDNKTEFPPVTPQEPRKGHWIHHDEERGICSEHWECSYCHKTTMTNPMYPYNDYDHMYYCPKCGADMREE